MIGVKVQTVERNSGTRVVRTTGHVEADETRVHRVMSGTKGWVQSVESNPPGHSSQAERTSGYGLQQRV